MRKKFSRLSSPPNPIHDFYLCNRCSVRSLHQLLTTPVVHSHVLFRLHSFHCAIDFWQTRMILHKLCQTYWYIARYVLVCMSKGHPLPLYIEWNNWRVWPLPKRSLTLFHTRLYRCQCLVERCDVHLLKHFCMCTITAAGLCNRCARR